MRAELIGRFKPCMTDIYLHIDARMADYIRTHPYSSRLLWHEERVRSVQCASGQVEHIARLQRDDKVWCAQLHIAGMHSQHISNK